MDLIQQDTQRYKKLFAKAQNKSDFIIEYKNLYSEEVGDAKQRLYHHLLFGIRKTIEEGCISNFINFINFLNYINEVEEHNNLISYYDHDNNPLHGTNVIILSCQHSSIEIVRYILNNFSTISHAFLFNLRPIFPQDKDKAQCTAFYYAISSSNEEILGMLIEKWPNKYFDENSSEKISDILCRPYEELKVKNVVLSKDMQAFVEDRLLDNRFLSCKSKLEPTSYRPSLSSINDRIELLIESIRLMNSFHTKLEEFIFTARFVAHNIFILKQQLKCTYDRLPWEEVEFCLTSYILTYIKKQEVNLFYQAKINQTKILHYLTIFFNKLENLKEYINTLNEDTLNIFPSISREDNIENIIAESPEFEDIYDDYQEIRDVNSLEKINNYVDLIQSADAKEREGHKIILRCLSVIAEYLKNTLESPKLSNCISEILLLSLSKITRNILIYLRDSESHTDSASKRLEIEETSGITYFTNIQSDIKRLGNISTYIHYKIKIRTFKDLLGEISFSDDIGELREITMLFTKFKFEDVKKDTFNSIEYQTVKKIIDELKRNIPDRTPQQEKLISEIDNTIISEKKNFIQLAEDFSVGATVLGELYLSFWECQIDSKEVKIAKSYAEGTLENLNIATKSSQCLQTIAEFAVELYRTCVFQIKCLNLDEIDRLTSMLINIAHFELEDDEWVERMKMKLSKTSFIAKEEESEPYSVANDSHTHELSNKLTELENILNSTILTNKMKIVTEKNDEMIQAVVELLIQDILAIIGSAENSLENNIFFLDDYSPLIYGKALLEHLAHDSDVYDILLLDPEISILVNAKKMVTDDFIFTKDKIGKEVKEDISALRNRFKHNLCLISLQQQMFAALEANNIQLFKDCIAQGADINGQTFNVHNILHVAAKGCDLEVLKSLLVQFECTNLDNMIQQSPLHIASARRNVEIVEILIQDTRININGKDERGRTPLHYAARIGDVPIIKTLLRHKANSRAKDYESYTPLHYAIRGNHIAAFMILLQEEKNFESNETISRFTPLHIAANKGRIEIMNVLLKFRANVGAKTWNGGTPLHLAAMRGHSQAVKLLISHGSDIDAVNNNGESPLHQSAENCHDEVVNHLLELGANVNIEDKVKNTPLYLAIRSDCPNVIKLLLKHKADVLHVNKNEETPIHLAIKEGNLDILEILVDSEPEAILKKNDFLILAVECGFKHIVAYLLSKNVNVNDYNESRESALHVAVSRICDLGIVELLIKHNADVNMKDLSNSTVLHSAVNWQHLSVVKLLLDNNADANAKSKCGTAPIHVASLNPSTDILNLLIAHGAEVNVANRAGARPLHFAACQNNPDVTRLLLDKIDQVNIAENHGKTPLHVASENGCLDVLEILIERAANVNALANDGEAPLSLAVKNNFECVAKTLIAKGADVDISSGRPVLYAVLSGNLSTLKLLLERGAKLDFVYEDGMSILHVAVAKNRLEIAELLIEKGVDIDGLDSFGNTPLFPAVEGGNTAMVQMLLKRKCKLNEQNEQDATALHLATSKSQHAVMSLLLAEGADTERRNHAGSTPLEMAVTQRLAESVRILLCHDNSSVNRPGYHGRTLMHHAALTGDLEVMRQLILFGANPFVADKLGNKPIHYAAGQRTAHAIEFFRIMNQSMIEKGARGRHPIHFAAITGSREVVEYLLKHGADHNARDLSGLTPIHLAALYRHQELVLYLLDRGVEHKLMDDVGHEIVDECTNMLIDGAMHETDELMESVRLGNHEAAVQHLLQGAMINFKDSHGLAALHVAAVQGSEVMVNVLLERRADPNIRDKGGYTPLHYAVKCGNLKITRILLANGAIYNPVANRLEKPSDLAQEKNIVALLKSIDDFFTEIEGNSIAFIEELKKIKNADTAKAIAGALNIKEHTLMAEAAQRGFSSLIDEFSVLWQDPSSASLRSAADFYFENGQYQEAYETYSKIYDNRRLIFGLKNPATLEMQYRMGITLCKLEKFPEAETLLEDTYLLQNFALGPSARDTLDTKTAYGLSLMKLCKIKESKAVFEQVHEVQKNSSHIPETDTLLTEFYLSLIVEEEQSTDKAIEMMTDVLAKQMKVNGPRHPHTVATKTKLAELEQSQTKAASNCKMQQQVYERRKETLGVLHPETRSAGHHLIQALTKQKKLDEAMKIISERYESEKRQIGVAHPDCLKTRQSMALIYLQQGRHDDALRIYRECRDILVKDKGADHPELQRFDLIIDGIASEIVKFNGLMANLDRTGANFMKNGKAAIQNDDEETIRRLTCNQSEINDKDADGRTLLHYAVDRGHLPVIKVLLQHGALVHLTSNMGNTPLHAAVLKGFSEVVDVLLKQANTYMSKISKLVNAKTKLRGTTALHIAAKNGRYEIVKSLLKYSAVYNIKNDDNETPLSLAKEPKVNALLVLVRDLFCDAAKGDERIVEKIKKAPIEEYPAIFNARNSQTKSAVQVAISKKHSKLAAQLLDIIKSVLK